MPSPESPLRGLRFSLRSLLFLVTFLAILLGTYKTLGPHGAIYIIDVPLPDCIPLRLLVVIGFFLSWLLVPLAAGWVPFYVLMSRRSPSFLALFAAGAVAGTVSILVELVVPLAAPAGRLLDLGPYCLLTMLTGSLLALVECGIKRLPWTAAWVSCAALASSLSFFCLLYMACQAGK
jgi:hypothetical protein